MLSIDPAEAVLLSMGAIGMAFTLFTLWVIRSMGRYNSYILLVINLTVAQMFYDLSVLFVVLPGQAGALIELFCRIFFGVASSLWTNIISFSAFFVVVYQDSFPVFKYFWRIFALITLLSAVPASGMVYNTYYYDWHNIAPYATTYQVIRLASILVNIIFYVYLQSYIIRELKIDASSPIIALTNRLRYYPLVQIITRIFVSIHELSYNYKTDYDSNKSTTYKTSSMLYSISLPSAAIGYFLVFILVTPGAIPHIRDGFRKMVGLRPLHGKQIGNFKEDTNSNQLTAGSSQYSGQASSQYSDSRLSSSQIQSEAYTERNSTASEANFQNLNEDELGAVITDKYHPNRQSVNTSSSHHSESFMSGGPSRRESSIVANRMHDQLEL